jgi:hypothetical protein
MKLFFKVVFLSTLSFLTGCANQPATTSGQVSVGTRHGHVDVIFTSTDRDLIHAYYAKAMGKPLPPGLEKKHHMTPGHYKQLRRHGHLPPGLERHPLPHRLDSQLSRLPQNFARLRIGNDIVLMDVHTNVIVDIIYNFGR